LVVTRTKIDLGENFGSSQLIKKNINSGKRIFVLEDHVWFEDRWMVASICDE
jgi:hypothetical protein